MEYDDAPPPNDYQEKTEWAFARLMFPGGPLDGYRGRFDGDWREGPRFGRRIIPKRTGISPRPIRRLTRVHVRSVEQCINLEDGDESYNWPWVYAVQVGEWGLTPKARKCCGTTCCAAASSWPTICTGRKSGKSSGSSMQLVFPDRPIVDIDDNDPIFHTVYDLDEKFQVPGAAHLRLGYKNDGKGAHWRGIYDDKGRIMIAISVNSDLGDAWEWADDRAIPRTSPASRSGSASITSSYAMSH